MPIIFHIAASTEWDAAKAAGLYAADSLAAEGYIHCSTLRQVHATANRIFKGRRDLVLLCVDTQRVAAEIRYENLEGGTSQFPHVYGPLEVTAVVAVHDLPPASDGTFEMPPRLREAWHDAEAEA
jgi:uncharacterized protein (DUF952 family)